MVIFSAASVLVVFGSCFCPVFGSLSSFKVFHVNGDGPETDGRPGTFRICLAATYSF